MDLLSIQSRWARIGFISLAVGICVILDIFLYPSFGMLSGMIMVVPVIAAAWYFGMHAAVPVVAVGTLSNMLAGYLAQGGEGQITLIVTNLIGMIPATISGYIVAHLRTRMRTRAHELVEHNNAEAERRAYAEFIGTLNDIVHAALEADDRQTLLETLVNRTGVLFSADDCFITIWDETNKIAIPQAAYGPMSQVYAGVPAQPGQRTLTSSVLEAEHAIVIDNVVNNPYVDPDVAEPFPNLVSVMGLPLIAGDRKLGGLILGYHQQREFTQKEVEQAEMAARQISLAIMKAILLDEAHKRVSELAVLHKISIAATEAFNENELIERVMALISERLYPDNFGILLLDENRNELYLHSSYWMGELAKPIRIPVGEGIVGSVAKSGRLRCENDVSLAPDYVSMDERIRSELCAPLKIGEQVIGVINAESSRLNAFTKEDEDLVSTMAAQIAIAIQRMRATETERHQTARLIRANALVRVLARVGAQIAVAQTPEGVMRALGDELAKMGLVCLVALPRDLQYMAIAYTSMSPSLIRYIERLARHPVSEFRIPYDRLMAYTGRDPQPQLLKDPLVITNNVLVDFPDKVAYRVLRPAGASEVMPLCHLPLIAEGKLNGLLWLWGEGLCEDDLPTLSIFASQVAIAIQNARLIEEVHRLAITDEGTGIFNRRHFFQLAEQEFSRAVRYKHPLSALIVDVDQFKAFNDHYGHIIGDLVLRQVAQTLKNSLREGDILGRYGGEEFSILLPYTDRESAQKVAVRLCKQVSTAGVKTESGILAVRVSIGAAELKPKTRHLLALVEAADQAMYTAKARGGNRAFAKR